VSERGNLLMTRWDCNLVLAAGEAGESHGKTPQPKLTGWRSEYDLLPAVLVLHFLSMSETFFFCSLVRG